jgi:hypothetical protein
MCHNVIMKRMNYEFDEREFRLISAEESSGHRAACSPCHVNKIAICSVLLVNDAFKNL